jgi:transcriptional regulator GlxA family with amidase domain
MKDPRLKDVLFVVLPSTLLLDLAGPAEAFRLANQQLVKRGQKPAYRLRYVGPAAQCSSSVGATLAQIEALPQQLSASALVVLLGQPSGAESPLQRPLSRAWTDTRRWLARVVAPHLMQVGDAPPRLRTSPSGSSAETVLLMTVCACTTHHEMLLDLQKLAPAATVLANRILVVDGPLASSAGVTAGIDLALHLIARDCGEALAAAVAQTMVVYGRRGPDEPELSPLLTGRQHLHAAIHRVQNAVADRPADDWSLRAMAQVAHVTPRHLSRLFEQHVGTTPRDYVQGVRVALAERALADGHATKRALAEAGIGGARQWRRLRARSPQTQAAQTKSAQTRSTEKGAETFANKSRGKSAGG